jgi:hypothetical protein
MRYWLKSPLFGPRRSRFYLYFCLTIQATGLLRINIEDRSGGKQKLLLTKPASSNFRYDGSQEMMKKR